jgi:hypothetical protein
VAELEHTMQNQNDAELKRWPFSVPAGGVARPERRSPARRDDDADAFEVLAWHRCDKSKPDSDISVLCWSREDGCFNAWWSDEAGAWVDCSSGGVCAVQPQWWSNPEGPEC